MATLIPSLNNFLRRMTSGERRFGRRLESHLENDYLCWYDVAVGPKRQHPDFVVLHPSRACSSSR
ncbi:NERD domain-containing protein [Halofilum ochraceum]|uniref:NERD domain-containing protein n=1 Tax=Halofilum ochraceum TaxID=1611323 RepID=UPI001FDFCD25|nr:NERD domain-containing protein [Halofilum ochraceum]